VGTECNGSQERQLEKLRRDLGEVSLAALADPLTVEIMLNADGTLWQERLGEQPKQIGSMSAGRAEAVLRTMAAMLHTTITREKPTLEGELPLDGSRFAGQIPPVVSAPVFAVRKRASRVFTLDQYDQAGILTPEQKEYLSGAIRDHRNILVIGGTGGGKTTLVNALIHELTRQFPGERLIIIEDTGEIQCAAANYVQYHTSPERSMTDLVRTSLRMRPDRILVGEVRGPEALDLLMAWNTGHEGGIATLHANSAESGLARLSTLISMHPNAPRSIEPLIGAAVDVLVHIARKEGGGGGGRIVREILELKSFDPEKRAYVFGAHLEGD
jgi:type IV secretion system protein VirB11